jgi:hypothetical protein
MRDIVLWIESAGLGDQLIYSTIPELFARRGFRVFVSNKTTTRNEEVRSLLYDQNPFVSGWTDATPNAGTGYFAKGIAPAMRCASIIQWIERAHDLPPTNLFPKIYYQPRFRPEFADAVIVDPHSITQRFPPQRFQGFVDRLELPTERMQVLESRFSGQGGCGALPRCPRTRVNTIYEYIDIIYSCQAFIGTESGSSALASAIRQAQLTPEIYVLTTAFNWNQRVYIYPNVLYTVLGSSPRDW